MILKDDNLEVVFKIICYLKAISDFAKDIHYSASGATMYGNHLFSDTVGDSDERNEYIDLIKEVFYLGRGFDSPTSADIDAKVAEIIPEKKELEEENWALLKKMIKECLVQIEMLTRLTRGEENLIGAVAQDLQQMNGLLGLRVDDVYDVEREDFKQ